MIIHDCEQGSDQWYELRSGIPTASEFSKLVTSKGDPSKSMAGYAVTLAGELYAKKPLDSWEGNQWTDRGKELEAEAVKYYEFVQGVTTEIIGFVTNDEKTAGCSPDRIVNDGEGLEIKCLKAETHIKTIMYAEKNGRCPTDYVQQTQGQMMLCNWGWCDLLFYHPELPSLIIRQTPDEAIHKALGEQISAVIKERDVIYNTIKSID